MPAPKRPNQVHVYLSDEEVGMLSHVATSCGLTQADVIRQALRSAYQMRLGIEIAKRGNGGKDWHAVGLTHQTGVVDYSQRIELPKKRKARK